MVNVTNGFQNVTDLKSMFEQVNSSVSYGWFALLFMMFVILAVSLIGFGVETAILTSAFISFVLALFLIYLGYISWTWGLMYLGLILGVIIWIIYHSPDE